MNNNHLGLIFPATAKIINLYDGVAAYAPDTGLCYGAYKSPMGAGTLSEIMRIKTIVECLPLDATKEALGERFPSRQVVESGRSTGQYMGCQIPIWLKMADGKTYKYVSIFKFSQELSVLKAGQYIISPGLVYQVAS